MKIENIQDLKKNINASSLIIFFVIFTSAILSLFCIHKEFVQRQKFISKQEIINVGNIYKSNLSEKLSIIASSNVFLDYLRSGYLSRKRLYSQFLSQISSLKSNSISGMQLSDLDGRVVFSYGYPTSLYVSLNLCYLNQTLDREMGDCSFKWKLYFREQDLLNEILAINHDVKICKDCDYYELISSKNFGGFLVDSSTQFKFKLTTQNKSDSFFYIYLFLITFSLILFGYWSWYRLNKFLSIYIEVPLSSITESLKQNTVLEEVEYIDELQFLLNEINIWKSRLNKIKFDENIRKIGKIAAQLAHDVRSPLSVIDMLVKDLKQTPSSHKIILSNAIQRISDIANNFLAEYKTPSEFRLKGALLPEYIPAILLTMIDEKRKQYSKQSINFIFTIDNSGWTIFSYINSVDFKRLLSNLINNSVESISLAGEVRIKLYKLGTYFRIEICDNGCGISNEMIPKILEGGVSIGKKDGSGLGLSHAMKKIEEWGGGLDIKSILGEGTEVGINLPLSNKMPEWILVELNVARYKMICILDDEASAHLLWRKRLQIHNDLRVSVKYLFHENKLVSLIKKNKQKKILFLIDYELGTDCSGLDIIKKYGIQKSAFLVTNRYDDLDVQMRAVELGVRIIPKFLILHLPIIGSDAEKKHLPNSGRAKILLQQNQL